MKKTFAFVAIIVIVAAVGGWYAWARNNKPAATTAASDTGTLDVPMNMRGSSSGTDGNQNETVQATDTVAIQNFAFTPVSITVKKGTKVTWTNKDSTAHTVTENDGKSGPASSDVNPGQTYSFTYNTVGTFQYHCSIHPSMTGSVTVTE